MLQALFIDDLRIKNASNFAFWGLLHLDEVTINNCQLSEAPSLAPIGSTLRKLSMEVNKLTCFPEHYFNECNVLREVFFGNNLLTAMPNVRNLNATIETIVLQNNRITSIEPLYFVPMTKLNSVDLSINLIVEIEFENIIWPAIKFIDLGSNYLTSINIYSLKSVLEKVQIQLKENPWHCDQKLCWLSHCNFRTGMRPGWGRWINCRDTESIKLVGDIICKGPDERKYQAINETGNRCATQGTSSLRPRQNGRLFADDTFKRIFLNENIRISTKNSLKFVPKGLITHIPALVLIMAWRRPGDKPLSEPMLVRSLTHICVTRPQ